MFRLGWVTFLERFPELVSPERRRRAVVIGVVVAVVALALLVWATVAGVWDPVPRWVALIASVLGAVGTGCVGAGLAPLGPRGWAIPPIPAFGWRTQEQVARYYRRNPPAVEPRHRDAVLHGLDSSRDIIVRSAFRGILLTSGWVFLFLGAIVFDLASWGRAGWIYAPYWPLLVGGTSAIGLRTLGRQEQLRVEAEALPPVPVQPKRGRPDARPGSKLTLPGE